MQEINELIIEAVLPCGHEFSLGQVAKAFWETLSTDEELALVELRIRHIEGGEHKCSKTRQV